MLWLGLINLIFSIIYTLIYYFTFEINFSNNLYVILIILTNFIVLQCLVCLKHINHTTQSFPLRSLF